MIFALGFLRVATPSQFEAVLPRVTMQIDGKSVFVKMTFDFDKILSPEESMQMREKSQLRASSSSFQLIQYSTQSISEI